MNKEDSQLTWMKGRGDEVVHRVKLLFKKDYTDADISTTALFRTCFMKILPKTCQWWKQVVDYNVSPTVSDVMTNVPPCAEAFLYLTIETCAERISKAIKPKTSNKHKLANVEEMETYNEKKKGKDNQVFGGRPKGEAILAGAAAKNKCIEIITEVNKRRMDIDAYLKSKKNETSTTPRGTMTDQLRNEITGDITNGEVYIQWYEAMTDEIAELRKVEQSNNETLTTYDEEEKTEVETENTAYMRPWIEGKQAKAKTTTGV